MLSREDGGTTCKKKYRRARDQVNERLREAIQSRADQHNDDVHPHQIEAGTQVWLDRVKVGYARKLAHMWHGPFRVSEMVDDYAARLSIAGTGYHLFPVVHVSKLKLVRAFPDRPRVELTVDEHDRFDFDEALLPEDSWEHDLAEDEYEVEAVVDMRLGRQTRYGRALKEYQVRWKVYEELSWVDEADLNCGALLREYERTRTNRNRFNVMQSAEAESGGV